MIRAVPALVLATLLTSCLSLDPSYERPAAPVPEQWPQGAAYAASAPAEQTALPEWRAFYADPKLLELIEIALRENRDLRVAALNIERARAAYNVQRADIVPSIEAGAQGNIGETPPSVGGTGATTRQYTATIGVTAFELDFFGRTRSLGRAALESYYGTQSARDAAQISLISDVASLYFAYAGDLDLLRLANDTLAAQAQSLELTQRRFDAGASSMLDVRRAQTTVESARADVARYTGQVAQDENALALLLGAPVPDALRPAGISAAAFGVETLPPGLPSDVLLARPDIREAEHALRGANANIGAARAAFFPSITIAGATGTADPRFESLFNGAGDTWSFVPRISIPLFTGGANLGRLGVAETDRDIAVARYERSIQIAFREVSDALAQYGVIDDELGARRALADASADSFRLSEARYRQGVDNYLSLLDAQRELYAARQGLVSAEVARAVRFAALYKALGGGV